MLDVTLLGGASFAVNGTVIRSDLGPAGRLLACYLFEFTGRTHRRERLADLFWGELEPEKARSALNTAIWRIRKILDLGLSSGGKHLVTIDDEILMEPSSCIHVDTHGLQRASQRAVTQARYAELTGADQAELGAAVESYRGPFLDGDDGDWILHERERLHCLFVRSTLALMRFAARNGEHECALDHGRRILATDPLRESVQRDVMVLLVLNGQRADAIRSYHNLKRLLRTDLGIDPMPDTHRLHQEIVSGEIFTSLEHYSALCFGAHANRA